MSEDIYIDVNYLTESERDIILQVLAKDEELRKQEKRRISTLKNELDQIKKDGATSDEIETSRICARCRSPLGWIINSGALCPKCEARVCKDCRIMTSYSWLCILCAKIREVRAESGAWFFEQERRKTDRPQLYGSALVRASFRRAKPASQAGNVVKNGDPGSPPVITLNLSNHERLHRPVPVHMSCLAEKDVEEKDEEEEDEDKGEEKKNAVEINQNYKQYVKANRVPHKLEEEQHDAFQQENGSSSSATSTPRGSPVNVLDSDVFEVADQEETVFEHLKKDDLHKIEVGEEAEEGTVKEDTPEWKANIRHGGAIANGYSVEEAQGYEEELNEWRNGREEESAHIDQQPEEHPVVEVKTKWHEVADEWGGTGDSHDQPAPVSYLHKQLLSVRSTSPDSETTGEFFTPLTTPLHSGTGTPTLSDYGQSEGMGSSSDVYEDAGDTTPVEGDRTPVSELEKDDVDNIGDVTLTNPEIKCTSPDMPEPEQGSRAPTHDDDIDQAFAMYEKDHPGTRTLHEQLSMLSMGSRESIVSYYSDAGEGRFGNVTVTGEVFFGLKYNKHKHQLEVQVHRAKDIAAADEKKGRSDPYVKVYLLPDKTKGGKRKTKTKKNTLNPDFDEILTFKIGFEEMVTRTLWLAMWNHDTFGHNDFLGEVMLPLETYQESGFNWDDPSPNWYPLHERRPEPSLMSYCGDMTVSLMYEPGEESNKDKKKKRKSGGKLHIQLKGARNLPAKDSNGFSDPFCKRNFPKLFDNNPRETKSEDKSEVDEVAEKPQTAEEVPLVSSHENLAFEEEGKQLEPKDTSTDSTTSTMETTLESIDSEASHDFPEDSQKEGDDSGISVSHVNGSDVNPTEKGTTTGGDEDDQKPEESERDMQPVLKSISAFAMQFTVVGPPEIKVDKPLTLSAAAKGQDKKDAPAPSPPLSPRRNTDHNIRNTIKKNTLLPEAALIKRRHSDFAVSAPKPINEELAIADLKKRGSQGTITARKGSNPDVIRTARGPQWSPSLERKKLEEAKKGKKIETRRKTLAELALEAGYTPAPDSTGPSVAHPKSLQVTKAEASRGSNESLLSDPGEEHYCSVPVTGELFVSLRYEMPSKKFEVHVHSANNLACADAKKSSSDPYVKSYLLPDRRSKRKTKAKKDTLNPHYDEVLEYFIGYDELLTRILCLSVWHKSIARNYFLGEVKIPVNNFVEAGNSLEQPIAKWFNLTDKSDETDGLPSIPCELVLALKYVTADKVKKRGRQKGELHVHLLEARNLPGMDADGMSDPYCKCILLPDKKGKFKHKTPIIKRTLNPTFDHKFSYDELSPDDLKERVLEITLYDFDRASSDEFLGGVRLGLGTSSNEWDDATEDECQIWHTMLSRSNVWIQVVVPLRSTMTPKKKE